MSLMKIVIHDIRATLEKENKIVLLLIIIIKTIDNFINVALLLRIVCFVFRAKALSCASYLEQKHFGLANIIFYDNMLVMKTLVRL